jgi:phosphonate transport system permease protein
VKWYHILFFLLILFWAVSGVASDLPRIISGIPHAIDYIGGMWPPSSDILPDLLWPLVETIQIAMLGTILASVVSVPIAFLAARNTAPCTAIYLSTRGLINTLRAIPVLLWAILFVAMVGLGPLAGVFAIVCHSIGALGKYMSESIESIGPSVTEVLESMRTEGASELQTMWYGLLPSVLPLFSSYILYYFEGNIREATVLGLVGAGGIGLYLTQTIRMFKRHETLTVVLVILVVVLLADAMSRQVRRRLIDD